MERSSASLKNNGPDKKPDQVYLAGAIEYAPDLGRGWRSGLRPFLRGTLGHEVYDPAEDERKSLTEEEQTNLRRWKTTDAHRFRVAVRKIIDFDLEILLRSSYIICHWDEYAARGGGTSSELTFAYRNGIPVYMVTRLDRARISGWILACCDEVFSSFDELKEFLQIRYCRSGDDSGG